MPSYPSDHIEPGLPLDGFLNTDLVCLNWCFSVIPITVGTLHQTTSAPISFFIKQLLLPSLHISDMGDDTSPIRCGGMNVSFSNMSNVFSQIWRFEFSFARCRVVRLFLGQVVQLVQRGKFWAISNYYSKLLLDVLF